MGDEKHGRVGEVRRGGGKMKERKSGSLTWEKDRGFESGIEL